MPLRTRRHLTCIGALVLALLWAQPAQAAVAVDGACTTGNGTGTSATINHTVGGSATLVVFLVTWTYGPAESITSGTWAGNAATQITGSPHTDANGNAVAMWYRVSPTTGAQDFVLSADATIDWAGGVCSFTGSDTTTPFGTWAEATNTSTTPTVDVTSVASGDCTIDVFARHGGTLDAYGAGQTSLFAQGGTTPRTGASYDCTSTGTVTQSYTVSTSLEWVIGAVPVKASGGGGGGGTSSRLSLLGAGN